jgi:hypothetical protein
MKTISHATGPEAPLPFIDAARNIFRLIAAAVFFVFIVFVLASALFMLTGCAALLGGDPYGYPPQGYSEEYSYPAETGDPSSVPQDARGGPRPTADTTPATLPRRLPPQRREPPVAVAADTGLSLLEILGYFGVPGVGLAALAGRRIQMALRREAAWRRAAPHLKAAMVDGVPIFRETVERVTNDRDRALLLQAHRPTGNELASIEPRRAEKTPPSNWPPESETP